VDIAEGMSFYMATDGFEDQLGEYRGSRYGERRFTKMKLIAVPGRINFIP